MTSLNSHQSAQMRVLREVNAVARHFAGPVCTMDLRQDCSRRPRRPGSWSGARTCHQAVQRRDHLATLVADSLLQLHTIDDCGQLAGCTQIFDFTPHAIRLGIVPCSHNKIHGLVAKCRIVGYFQVVHPYHSL